MLNAIKKRFIDSLVSRRQKIIGKEFDLIVGGPESPHFYRWELFKCRWFKIYLHHFVADDNDPILHDHKYVNLSIPLIGGYYEEQFISPVVDWFKRRTALPPTALIERKQGGWYFRRPTTAHRIELQRRNGLIVDCWSVFFCGPEVRNWGFWTKFGWKPWNDLIDGDYGSRGISKMADAKYKNE